MGNLVKALKRRWATVRYELGWPDPQWLTRHLEKRSAYEGLHSFILKFDSDYVRELVEISENCPLSDYDTKRIAEIGIVLYQVGGVPAMLQVLEFASKWTTSVPNFNETVISTWKGIGSFPFYHFYDYLDCSDTEKFGRA